MPKLVLSSYTPNTRDPRVRRRIAKVLEYCKGMVEHNVERPIMAKDLRKLFGNYSHTEQRNDLASWLYSNLLHQTLWYQSYPESSYPHPYSYRVNVDGYNKVLKLLEDSAERH